MTVQPIIDSKKMIRVLTQGHAQSVKRDGGSKMPSQTKTEYCQACKIAISPHDPSKRVVNGNSYHKECLKPAVTNCKPRQLHFRFQPMMRCMVQWNSARNCTTTVGFARTRQSERYGITARKCSVRISARSHANSFRFPFGNTNKTKVSVNQ